VTVATRFLVPLVVAASSAVISPAWGQTAGTPAPGGGGGSATDNRALAEMLFFTARGLMEAGRTAEACAKLSESYRLDPAAGTLLNLAVCHEKEGKIASAWGEFHEAIADARKANRPEREKLATERVAAIEPDLPFLTITVPDEVRKIPGLVISRNGVPLNAAAWSTELPVDPGEVQIEERAPDYKPKDLKITLANKQHASIAAEPLELAPIFRPSPPYWTTKRTVGAVLFVGGVVSAGVGTYFGITALNNKSSSDQNCPNDAAGVQRCTQTGVNDMNNANTAAWVSDITIGAGAAAALVGAYLFVTGGESQEGPVGPALPPAAWHWTWHLSGGPRSAGGVVSTTF
jgi:tetratricopeptide (TPR) repeat protein